MTTCYEIGIITPVFSNQRPSCHIREDEQHDMYSKESTVFQVQNLIFYFKS